jgi:hypothetical protein
VALDGADDVTIFPVSTCLARLRVKPLAAAAGTVDQDVDHHRPVLVDQCGLQVVTYVAAFLDADALGAERSVPLGGPSRPARGVG